MVPVNHDQAASTTTPTTSAAATSSDAAPMETSEKVKKEESVEEKSEVSEIKGDPEVAPKYVQHLLPVFTEVFQITMLTSIK